MVRNILQALVDPTGRTGRLGYAAAVLPLAALASLFALFWPLLVVIAIATARRLRDAGLTPWLALLTLVPYLGLVLVVVAAVPPPAAEADARPIHREPVDRSAAVAAVLGTALVAVGLAFVGASTLETYGWTIFVALPFVLGLVAVVVYGFREPRTLRACLTVALASLAVALVAVLATAIEGAICIVMAAPLTVPLALAGATTGYFLQTRPWRQASAGLLAAVAIVPGMFGLETTERREPARVAVSTTVVVDAPPEGVWRYVVAVPELPPPRELIFRTGIAYPTRATIERSGVGAVRRCTFSTGDFVEPITVWRPARLLRFAVVSQPAPMRELSPYGAIHPPHLDGFLRSEQGEFRLTPLSGGRTLLRGTTWYRNRMWPSRYWQLWSDAVVHRIHRRVLEHVARLAEAENDEPAPGPDGGVAPTIVGWTRASAISAS